MDYVARFFFWTGLAACPQGARKSVFRQSASAGRKNYHAFNLAHDIVDRAGCGMRCGARRDADREGVHGQR